MTFTLFELLALAALAAACGALAGFALCAVLASNRDDAPTAIDAPDFCERK